MLQHCRSHYGVRSMYRVHHTEYIDASITAYFVCHLTVRSDGVQRGSCKVRMRRFRVRSPLRSTLQALTLSLTHTHRDDSEHQPGALLIRRALSVFFQMSCFSSAWNIAFTTKLEAFVNSLCWFCTQVMSVYIAKASNISP
jgi:hypothetical protein